MQGRYNDIKFNPASSAVRLRMIKTGIAFLILVAIFCLGRFPGLVERYYSQGLYPLIRNILGIFFNYIPFSAGDLLYGMIIIFIIIGFVRLIRALYHRSFRRAGFILLGFVYNTLVFVIIFYLLWAMNYFRTPAAERLALRGYDYNQAQLVQVAGMLVDSANQARASLTVSDRSASRIEITTSVNAIRSLQYSDPPQLAIRPAAKPSLLSKPVSFLGTAGYYNPFTGEAQFNDVMPVFTQPFIACHEMAHQMGFGAEDEANFIGFIAGKGSADRLLRYSAYYSASQEFLAEVWRVDSVSFKNIKERISPAVMKDLETERQYWIAYQGSAQRLTSIFYDNYLKANRQPGGLQTYNRMIRLTMAYYKKRGL